MPWLEFRTNASIIQQGKLEYFIECPEKYKNKGKNDLRALANDLEMQEAGLEACPNYWQAVLTGKVAIPREEPLREIVPLYAKLLPRITAVIHGGS